MHGEAIIGRVASGIGQGRHFTRLGWAREQFIGRLGIDPYPGTLNLVVEDAAALQSWSRLKALPGIRIDNPGSGPHDCDARCWLVSVEGRFEAAIVLPEVEGYAPGNIELIAAVGLREALAIGDGALVSITPR